MSQVSVVRRGKRGGKPDNVDPLQAALRRLQTVIGSKSPSIQKTIRVSLENQRRTDLITLIQFYKKPSDSEQKLLKESKSIDKHIKLLFNPINVTKGILSFLRGLKKDADGRLSTFKKSLSEEEEEMMKILGEKEDLPMEDGTNGGMELYVPNSQPESEDSDGDSEIELDGVDQDQETGFDGVDQDQDQEMGDPDPTAEFAAKVDLEKKRIVEIWRVDYISAIRILLEIFDETNLIDLFKQKDEPHYTKIMVEFRSKTKEFQDAIDEMLTDGIWFREAVRIGGLANDDHTLLNSKRAIKKAMGTIDPKVLDHFRCTDLKRENFIKGEAGDRAFQVAQKKVDEMRCRPDDMQE